MSDSTTEMRPPWWAVFLAGVGGGVLGMGLLYAIINTHRDLPGADCPLTNAALAEAGRMGDIGLQCSRALDATVDELAATTSDLHACQDNEKVATEGWASCVTFSEGLLADLSACRAKTGRLASYDNPDDCPDFYLDLLMDVRYCYDNGPVMLGDAGFEGCVYAVLAERSWDWPRPTVTP